MPPFPYSLPLKITMSCFLEPLASVPCHKQSHLHSHKQSFPYFTLWGDKVSVLTHIYPHKPWREIEVTICKITRLTAHFMCVLMSDLLICTCL